MKHIEKKVVEPAIFEKWHKQGGWDACDPNNPKSFNPKALELKQEIRNLLLCEQGDICCYCEERIKANCCHIEHLNPKGRPEFATLKSSYSNLLCSCNHGLSCGKAKENAEIGITPLMEDCEEHFTYTDDGKIEGKNQKAIDTIGVLKINSERLNAARHGVISVLLHSDGSGITLSEYDSWIQDYLTLDAEGRYKRYWSAIKFIANKYRDCYE